MVLFMLFHINSIGLRSGEYGEYHDNRFVIIINRPYRPQKLIEALYLCVLRKTYKSLSHNWIKNPIALAFILVVFFYMWFSIIETPNPHRVSCTLGRTLVYESDCYFLPLVAFRFKLTQSCFHPIFQFLNIL